MGRKETLSELLEAVDNINDCMYQGHGNYDIIVPLSVTTDGINIEVQWNQIQLWSNEDDEREWIEESKTENNPDADVKWKSVIVPAHYEAFEPHLRKKVNELITNISKIKL